MLTFIKDLMSLAVLGGFSLGALTWMDFASAML